MTKVRGPMFSVTASGTLGKTITYKKGVTGHVARINIKPKSSETADQVNVRVWFQRGVWTWQGKSDQHGYHYSSLCTGLQEPARKAWREFRDVKSLYGYYSFMKRWMINCFAGFPQYQVPPNYGFCVADEWYCDDLICDGVFHNWS